MQLLHKDLEINGYRFEELTIKEAYTLLRYPVNARVCDTKPVKAFGENGKICINLEDRKVTERIEKAKEYMRMKNSRQRFVYRARDQGETDFYDLLE